MTELIDADNTEAVPQVLIDYLLSLAKQHPTAHIHIYKLETEILSNREVQQIVYESDIAATHERHTVFGFDPVDATVLGITEADQTSLSLLCS